MGFGVRKWRPRTRASARFCACCGLPAVWWCSSSRAAGAPCSPPLRAYLIAAAPPGDARRARRPLRLPRRTIALARCPHARRPPARGRIRGVDGHPHARDRQPSTRPQGRRRMRARSPAAPPPGCALLFVVQRCRQALAPVLGGAPAVWKTCMVFFRRPCSGLPVRAPPHHYLRPSRRCSCTRGPGGSGAPPPSSRPRRPSARPGHPRGAGIAGPLDRRAALVLASTGPLLSAGPRWSRTRPLRALRAGTPAARRLRAYPSSSTWSICRAAGGMGGRLPRLRAILAGCTGPCGAAARWRTGTGRSTCAHPPIPWKRKVLWMTLPSAASVMIGVTQYLTLDVAASPLLWSCAGPLPPDLRGRASRGAGNCRRRAGFVLAVAAVPAAGPRAYSRLWGFAFPVYHLLALVATGIALPRRPRRRSSSRPV